MNRHAAFESFKSHAWFKKLYLTLTAKEVSLCTSFISDNHKLDKMSFELAVNRLFLDKEKPKHWKEIQELLTCANSKASS